MCECLVCCSLTGGAAARGGLEAKQPYLFNDLNRHTRGTTRDTIMEEVKKTALRHWMV